jgi:cell wall assembly regulator SMI1
MRSKNISNNQAAEAIRAAWQRIERWMAVHAPTWVDQHGPRPLFHPPASNEALAQLEARLHLTLPDQFRALLLTSNGCQQGEYPLPMRATRPTKWRTISVAEVAEEWDLLNSIAANYPFNYSVRTVGPVQPVWWSQNWIPLGECGMGDVVCADMNPAPGGSTAQLILYEHDFEERKVLYPSLLNWLRECADDLENGEYVYIDGLGLYHKDEQVNGEVR